MMTVWGIEDLLGYWHELRVSKHALREAYKEGLHGRDILHAIFKGQVIEHYPERRRVLIAGPIKMASIQLHVVCDYTDKDEIVAVTVYVPHRSQWVADLVRRR
jgi:hypothetical protein